MKNSDIQAPILLTPEYREYIWGGHRLRSGESLTAEAWVVYEHDRIASGPFSGKTLAELVIEYPEQIVGAQQIKKTGTRFPLLIKILDCAQWLSLQVHPDDYMAKILEGPGHFGKTEAWHMIEVVPDGRIIAGLKPNIEPEVMKAAIRSGKIMLYTQELAVHTGDTLFIDAGTLHAIGPGLLICEVQQTSNLTYRVYDWDRPQTDERVLHIEKSIAAVKPDNTPTVTPMPKLKDGTCINLGQNQYFTLEIIHGNRRTIQQDTRQRSFHTLTVIDGSAKLSCRNNDVVLNRFDSVVIPASCGEYQISPINELVKILKSRVG